MKQKLFTSITLLLMVTTVLGESLTNGLSKLEIKLKEAMEKEASIHSDFKIIFKKSNDKVKKHEEKQRNDNISTASLGRIEQLKLKAEKYSFELQLRRNIVSDMKEMEKLIDKWADAKMVIASLRKDIKTQKQILAMNLKTLKSQKDRLNENGAPVILDKDVEGYWTVQKPSTLKELAELIFNDESRWQDLYNINKDELGENPTDIVPKGVELIVPTEEQAKMFENYNKKTKSATQPTKSATQPTAK